MFQNHGGSQKNPNNEDIIIDQPETRYNWFCKFSQLITRLLHDYNHSGHPSDVNTLGTGGYVQKLNKKNNLNKKRKKAKATQKKQKKQTKTYP